MSQTILQSGGTQAPHLGTISLSPGAPTPQTLPGTLPRHLQEAFATLPKLTHEQCGHLRHFHNLASQPAGEFASMGAEEPGQEWDTAYRYQIATMAYGAGAAHYHRLPAMRSLFKTLLERLIKKMLRREVWGYWYLTSQSGVFTDPDLKELRKPWADPVCKENIMYSGHLLLMVSLYTMLFNDRRFDEEDSLVFDWNPLFFGMGPERYSYTRRTLQETILKEMEREKWMGVCCEPNMLIAMRYNDVVDDTKVIDDVLVKYKAAWTKKGMISENGLFRTAYAVRRDTVIPSDELAHSAWTMAFMPWNYAQIQSMYPSTGLGALHRVNNRINVHSPIVTNTIKSIVATSGGQHDDPSIIARARAQTATAKLTRKPYLSPTFGYVAQWLSEIAPRDDLDALLAHADAYLSPSWANGGLYYARCDKGWDQDGNYTYVDPYTGNAAIGYARLNVRHGQKTLWDHPWTKEEVEKRPWVDGVELGDGADCLRGLWDEDRGAMVVTLCTWDAKSVLLKPLVRRLPVGNYGVYVDGKLRRVVDVKGLDDVVAVELEVAEEVDLVVLRA